MPKTKTSPFKPGDRIELVLMGDDPSPVEPGTRGTVESVDWFQDAWTLQMKWDNGRTLALIIPPDKVKKVKA